MRRTLGSMLSILLIASTLTLHHQAQAATADSSSAESREATLLQRVTVTGGGTRAKRLPGSAVKIDAKTLDHENQVFDDIHRVLLRVPGVTVIEEDGFGLRPNIGLRGSGSERSSNITLMEDGVLAAPAPYAAPSAYYFPITGRMSGVEVRKGSSQVRFGPRTNGGALNLLSTSIPNQMGGVADVAVGEYGTRKAHLNLGDSKTNFGWMAETYQLTSTGFKVLDGGGNTGFELGDYLGKFRVNTSPSASTYHEFTLKGGYTKQDDRETYLGLTDDDFAATPDRRYAGSQVDNMNTEHTLGQGRYFMETDFGLDITATAYVNRFKRNWYKLDKVSGTSISDILASPDDFTQEMSIIRGETATVGGDLAVKANNRSYWAYGLETTAGLKLDGGSITHDLVFGARIHADEEDRYQWSDTYRMTEAGTMSRITTGTPGAAGGGDNRVNHAKALALYATDDLDTGKWMISPGLRFEHIVSTRDQYDKNDPDRVGSPTETESTIDVLLPGLGASYEISSALIGFAGVHRGFAPPGPGADDSTEAETSLNSELGLRWNRDGLSAELGGFWTEYSNLLGKDTFVSGGQGSGDQYNGGKARALGLEATATWDPSVKAGWGDLQLPISVAYTFTQGTFLSSFESDYEPWAMVTDGDHFPYLPEHVFNLGVSVIQGWWRLGASGNYMSAMRTVAGTGPIPTDESTDARFILDLTGEVQVLGNARVFASMQNVTDNAYIAARRPSGVRPGGPRTFMAGVKVGL